MLDDTVNGFYGRGNETEIKTMDAYRVIDQLKSNGHFFAAGALAFESGKPEHSYGCHFGLRSTIDSDRARFYAGYAAAKAGARS